MNLKSFFYSKFIPSSETPRLIHVLVKNKVVRTESQAIALLLCIIIMSSVLAFHFFSRVREVEGGYARYMRGDNGLGNIYSYEVVNRDLPPEI